MVDIKKKLQWDDDLVETYDFGLTSGLTFKEILESERPDSFSNNPMVHLMAQNVVEQQIADSIRGYAEIQLEVMRRSNDYGLCSQTIVEQGHRLVCLECHNPDRPIADIIPALSSDQLKEYMKTWSIKLLSQNDVPINDAAALNRELEYVGSRMRVQTGMSDTYLMVILGECEFRNDHNELTYLRFLEPETIRSPIAAPVIPAYAIPGTYVVRRAACEYSADYKYLPTIQGMRQGLWELETSPGDPRHLQELLDAHVARNYLQIYGNDLNTIHTNLVEDIESQARFYCSGELIHHRFLGVERVALAMALEKEIAQDCGNLIALGECSVETGGALFEFVHMADTEPVMARLHLLMFLSDNFYLGHETLEEKSYLLLAAFIPAIINGNLDRDYLKNTLWVLQDLVETYLVQFLDKVAHSIRNAKHVNPSTGGIIDHETVQKQIDIFITKNSNSEKQKEQTNDDYKASVAQWWNQLIIMKRLAYEDYANLLIDLYTFRQTIDRLVIEKLFPDHVSRYGDDLKALLTQHIIPQAERRLRHSL